MVNFNQFMKQAQDMQKKMQDAQEKLLASDFHGKSGGGMVNVIVNGKMEMKKITIDSSIIKESEKEVLEDLIIAAYNDAKTKAETASGDAMSQMMGGMALPPGFKMPF